MSPDDISARLDITAPFLMIDSFQITEAGQAARATKTLHADDWYFAAHLPSSQVMPATLLTEAMLQTLVLLIYESVDHGAHRSFIHDIAVKVMNAAKPGQELVLDARLLSFKRGIAKGEVVATADGKVLARGNFSYASPHLMALPS